MSNKITRFLIKLAFEGIYKISGFGLKSTINTLSITPDLSPGLLNINKNRALAPNSFLFMIPDTYN